MFVGGVVPSIVVVVIVVVVASLVVPRVVGLLAGVVPLPVSVVVFLFSELLLLVVVDNVVGQLDELDLHPSDVDGVGVMRLVRQRVGDGGVFDSHVHPVVHVLQGPLDSDTGLLFDDNGCALDGI